MPDQNNPPKFDGVEKIEVKNTIKQRAVGIHGDEHNEGFIAPELIDEAEKEVLKLCTNSPAMVGESLEKLNALWNKMKDLPASPERSQLSDEIFLQAHEIKDISAMCGYELISYFSESLRDYINKAELSVKAQVVIIQAHLDALAVVHSKGYKSDAGAVAEELKLNVKKAIDKYS